jgi:hypothetical protein
MKLDFSAISQKQQSTEHVSVLGHNTLTSSQPVFVFFLYLILRGSFSLPDPPWIFFFIWSSVDLFLYLILRGSFSLPDPPWIFFFIWSSVLSRHYICLFISVLSLQIQLSRRPRTVIQFFNILPYTCLYKSQARNWISIDICCGLFF